MKIILKNSSLAFVSAPKQDMTFIAGRYILNTDMSVITSGAGGYSSTDKYEVSVGSVIKVKNCATGTLCDIICAFTSDNVRIEDNCWGAGTTQDRDVWHELTITDSRVKYVVVGTRNENFDTPNTGYEAVIIGSTSVTPLV